MTYEETLSALAAERKDLMILTAENRAHIRCLATSLGERFVDVGIAEQTLVGMAAGLALRGRTPVVHALAPFLTMRAFEFIRTDVALPRLPVKLVGMIPGFLSDGNGPTHQALEDIALMRTLPGMSVFCPADATELALGMAAVIDLPGPCYVRYTQRERCLPAPAELRPGKAEVLARGSDVTLLSYGLLASEAYSARELLEQEGVSTGVLNVRWLAPLDEDAIVEAAQSSRHLFVIEDHFAVGGLYSAIAELFLRRRLSARVTSVALSERWFTPGTLSEVLEHEGFNARALADQILAASSHSVLAPSARLLPRRQS